MSREIPEPIRAAAGLAATVLDEARKLPETLPGLPVRAIGLAMQTALRLQQQWSGLVARGDELFTGLRGEDEPGLATFDDDDGEQDAPAPSARASAFDRAAADVPDDLPAEVTDDAEPIEAEPIATDDVTAPDLLGTDLPAVEPEPAVDAVAELVEAVDAVESVDAVAPEEPVEAIAPIDAVDAETVLTAEDALDAALLESDLEGASADAGRVDVSEADLLGPDGELQAPETADGVDVTEVDVLAPEGEAVATVATLPEDAVAVPDDVDAVSEPADVDAPLDVADVADVPAETPETPETPEEAAEEVGSAAAGAAPISGYDSWTVAQLRGRLRGYQLTTVAELLAYEDGTRAREPFQRMLRNRLEKLERQAVEASPFAPRG